MRNAIVCVVLAFFGLFANLAYSEDGTSDLQAAVDAVVSQEAKNPWVPAVSLSFTAKSQYVTGNGYANGSAVQEDLNFSWSFGFYADLWHSGGSYRKLDESFADEVDYTVGFAKGDFNLAISYFDLHELGVGRGDILDPSLTWSHMFDIGAGNSLTPMVKVENAFTLPDWDNRWIFTAGVTHSLDLGWQGAMLSNTVKVVYDNGTRATASGALLRWRVGLDVPLCEDKSVTLGVGYERYWMANSIRDREDVGSVEMSLTFKF